LSNALEAFFQLPEALQETKPWLPINRGSGQNNRSSFGTVVSQNLRRYCDTVEARKLIFFKVSLDGLATNNRPVGLERFYSTSTIAPTITS